MMFRNMFFILLAASALALHRCPAVCVSDPPLLLDAGTSNVSAIINNDFGPCQARIHFSDPNFLPITYQFNNVMCRGIPLASFTLPPEAPNGDGCVVWQCAGQNMLTCNAIIVSGGISHNNLTASKNGTVGCILDTTQTRTSLITVTTSSWTVTQTSTSIFTTQTTSLQEHLDLPTPTANATTLNQGAPSASNKIAATDRTTSGSKNMAVTSSVVIGSIAASTMTLVQTSVVC
ncbi:hypothetical protein F5Y02DRAFT_418979 [Annulohypoxylon stygium]|nr:hypothetical protein F5Y02DRAFT_418979 [Annulohypoxylon stygium]